MDQFGNPSPKHEFGLSARPGGKKVLQQLQALIGAEFEDEIAFTSGGHESDNAASLSGLDVMPHRRKIVTPRSSIRPC